MSLRHRADPVAAAATAAERGGRSLFQSMVCAAAVGEGGPGWLVLLFFFGCSRGVWVMVVVVVLLSVFRSLWNPLSAVAVASGTDVLATSGWVMGGRMERGQ